MIGAEWKNHPVTARADGSYLIVVNGNGYHVPNEGEWTELHARVKEYADAHPEQVIGEHIPTPTMDELRTRKMAEILVRADKAKSMLSGNFSQVEEGTWPEQEAGARTILGSEGAIKNATARLILLDDAAKDAAVSLVETLAAIDGATPEAFAERIAANADAAHALGILTLTEQRGYEARLKAAATADDIRAIEVVYTVLQQAARNAA